MTCLASLQNPANYLANSSLASCFRCDFSVHSLLTQIYVRRSYSLYNKLPFKIKIRSKHETGHTSQGSTKSTLIIETRILMYRTVRLEHFPFICKASLFIALQMIGIQTKKSIFTQVWPYCPVLGRIIKKKDICSILLFLYSLHILSEQSNTANVKWSNLTKE